MQWGGSPVGGAPPMWPPLPPTGFWPPFSPGYLRPPYSFIQVSLKALLSHRQVRVPADVDIVGIST
jgi:hypothetical protein